MVLYTVRQNAKRRTNNDDASWQRAESHAYSTVPNSLTTACMRMTTCDIARMMICVVTVDGTPDSYGLFIANDLIWPQLDWTSRPSYTSRSLVTRVSVTTRPILSMDWLHETRTITARLVLSTCTGMRPFTLEFANRSLIQFMSIPQANMLITVQYTLRTSSAKRLIITVQLVPTAPRRRLHFPVARDLTPRSWRQV